MLYFFAVHCRADSTEQHGSCWRPCTAGIFQRTHSWQVPFFPLLHSLSSNINQNTPFCVCVCVCNCNSCNFLMFLIALFVAALRRLGVKGVEIRKPEQLHDVTSLIIPGGESTTMAKLAEYHNLVSLIYPFCLYSMYVRMLCFAFLGFF